MGKLTKAYKQRLGDILIGAVVNDRDLKYFRFGTSATPTEDESNDQVYAPVGSDKQPSSKERVNKTIVLAAFWAGGELTNGINLRELAMKFNDGVVAIRHTKNLNILTSASTDIRADVTIVVEQA